MVGYNVTSWRDARPEVYRQDLAAVLGAVADGSIKPLIGATMPLSQAVEAHQMLEQARVAGKIVLTP